MPDAPFIAALLFSLIAMSGASSVSEVSQAFRLGPLSPAGPTLRLNHFAAILGIRELHCSIRSRSDSDSVSFGMRTKRFGDSKKRKASAMSMQLTNAPHV